MADAEKLDRILNRLDDINKLRSEINEWKNELTERLNNTEVSLNHAHDEIKDLKVLIDTKAMSILVSDLRKDFENEVLKNQIHSFKYNLIFSGIPGEEINKGQTDQVLRDFWVSKLSIPSEAVDCIYLADVHRLGLSQNGKPRNIIAKFLQLSDRDYVLRMGKNLKPYRSTKRTANGSIISYQSFSMSEHLPPILKERKKELWPYFKRATSLGLKRQFRVVGTKILLFINGQKFVPGSTDITENGLRRHISTSSSSTEKTGAGASAEDALNSAFNSSTITSSSTGTNMEVDGAHPQEDASGAQNPTSPSILSQRT